MLLDDSEVHLKAGDVLIQLGTNHAWVNNSDKPGFIGSLGALLGEASVNIATFNLGREAAGGDAIALVGVDQDPPPATLAAIEALPQVRYVKVLRF